MDILTLLALGGFFYSACHGRMGNLTLLVMSWWVCLPLLHWENLVPPGDGLMGMFSLLALGSILTLLVMSGWEFDSNPASAGQSVLVSCPGSNWQPSHWKLSQLGQHVLYESLNHDVDKQILMMKNPWPLHAQIRLYTYTVLYLFVMPTPTYPYSKHYTSRKAAWLSIQSPTKFMNPAPVGEVQMFTLLVQVRYKFNPNAPVLWRWVF